MDEFYMDPRQLHAMLSSKGITHFYHANTILTSLTFITAKSLLSHGYIESHNLVQTQQKSDTEDKRFGVWDHIFLDGVDLHKKYNRANLYGPVLFAMKVSMLTAPEFPKILVTKNNPMYWKENEVWSNRYYSDIAEVQSNYLTGKVLDSRIMFTLKSPELSIKLNKYLDYILIDDPKVTMVFKKEKVEIGEKILSTLKDLMSNHGLGHIPIKLRHNEKTHSLFCRCLVSYNWLANFNYEEFKKRFRTKAPV